MQLQHNQLQSRHTHTAAAAAEAATARLTMEPVCHKECAFLIILPGLRAFSMHNEGSLKPISLVASCVIMPQVAAGSFIHLKSNHEVSVLHPCRL